ncbi:hypothetical protein ACEQ8H_003064 [Pleosporales sp. CAS-2024a]
MDYVDWVFDNLNLAKDRLVDNSIKSFEGMTAQRWIRIVVIIGGYLLLRPFLLGFAAKRQKAQFEKNERDLGLGDDKVPNANSLRGGRKSGGGKVLDDAGTRQRK